MITHHGQVVFFPEMRGWKLIIVMYYINKLKDKKNDHCNKHRNGQEKSSIQLLI